MDGRVAGQCAGIWDAPWHWTHGRRTGTVGTGRTDVAHGPLALDARTSHMAVGTGRTDVAHGPLALDVRDVANRGRSWLGIDRQGRRSLKGVSM